MILRLGAYLVVVFATHHIAALVQASLHCLIAHRAVGRSLYSRHLYCHHKIYSSNTMVSDSYLDEEESITFYYLLPLASFALLGYACLPLDFFVVHISSLFLSFWAHVYLHVQYHLRDSWLSGQSWFRARQRLHLLHHKNVSRNFAVIEFFWDKVLGTYQEAPVGMGN